MGSYPQQIAPRGRLQLRCPPLFEAFFIWNTRTAARRSSRGSINLLADVTHVAGTTSLARRRRRPVASGGPLSDSLPPPTKGPAKRPGGPLCVPDTADRPA